MINKKVRQRQKNRIVLLVLLVPAGIIIFPFGWLAQIWPTFGLTFNWLFHSELTHIIAHGLLFAGVGWAALTIAPKPFGHWLRYLLFILSLAIIQESLQYATFKHSFHVNSLFDLAVDMVGAGISFAAKKLSQLNSPEVLKWK